MNCQAVSDVHGRILDFLIGLPGTSSDCIAFEGSNLYERLEGNLLKKGLVLFGDNAYLNTRYMATPLPNAFHQVPRMIIIIFILEFVFELSAHLDNLFQGGEF